MTAVRPWVGRSYAHLILPVPHLDSALREKFTKALAVDGWEPVPDDEARAEAGDSPLLAHRWRHAGAGTLLLVVLAWYPLVATIGSDGRPNPRARRAMRRLVDVVREEGGRELPDGELDRVLHESEGRWRQAVAARQAIEENRRWLECRQCGACGAWSAYGVLHCRGCSRRFAPADDTERDERGATAAEATAVAEETLTRLGRGADLFPDWPEPLPDPPGPAPTEGVQR